MAKKQTIHRRLKNINAIIACGQMGEKSTSSTEWKDVNCKKCLKYK